VPNEIRFVRILPLVVVGVSDGCNVFAVDGRVIVAC